MVALGASLVELRIMCASPGNPIPPDSSQISASARPRGPLASVGVPDPRAFGAVLAARRREARQVVTRFYSPTRFGAYGAAAAWPGSQLHPQ
jgi:hypothetical protein